MLLCPASRPCLLIVKCLPSRSQSFQNVFPACLHTVSLTLLKRSNNFCLQTSNFRSLFKTAVTSLGCVNLCRSATTAVAPASSNSEQPTAAVAASALPSPRPAPLNAAQQHLTALLQRAVDSSRRPQGSPTAAVQCAAASASTLAEQQCELPPAAAQPASAVQQCSEAPVSTDEETKATPAAAVEPHADMTSAAPPNLQTAARHTAARHAPTTTGKLELPAPSCAKEGCTSAAAARGPQPVEKAAKRKRKQRQRLTPGPCKRPRSALGAHAQPPPAPSARYGRSDFKLK